MNKSPNVTEASILATYQDGTKNTCYIIKPTLENDPSRNEITLYRDGDNIVPVIFSIEDCQRHYYWSREDGSPEPFIRDMADRVTELLDL